MTALEFKDVSASYGPYRALNGLSVRIGAGEAVAVLGRNGVGKSTLARVASGLVRPSSGTVEVLSHQLPVSVHALARLGVVHLPEGVGLFSGLSIEENLLLRLRHVSRTERQHRLSLAYDTLGALAQRRRTRAGLLSGGQQRLVAVAGALAATPKLLLADEPALGLSPVATDDVYGALAKAKSLDTALVVIETRPARVEALCPRSVVIETGAVLYDGDTSGASDVLKGLLDPGTK